MILIMGHYDNAVAIARQAGLQHREWRHLSGPEVLIGTHAPDVVVLRCSATMKCRDDIEGMLFERSATFWTELDLLNGKVPR